MRHLRAAFLAFALSLTLSASFGAPALADAVPLPSDQESAPLPIHTEIPIPTSPVEQGVNTYSNGVVRDVADYIQVIYNFLISIVGVIAAVMMIIGGFQYLTSAGDAGKIGAAKKRITDAIIGLVLALSSYALLNTINPALLSFKPLSPGINAVTTELSFLPWCEDEPTSSHVQALSASDCGNIGTFTPPGGKGTDYCVFHSTCTALGERDNTQTCLQKPGMTTKDLQDLAKSNMAAKVARCVPCWAITINASKELGYSDLPTACRAWMVTLNQFRGKTPNQNLWSYCGEADKWDAGGNPSCVQVDIDCHLANTNSDGDLTSSANDPQCNENSDDSDRACGCNGYDDEPNERWSTSNKALKDNTSPSGSGNELDDYPKHLAAVCSWNPCMNYVDDSITPHQISGLSTTWIGGLSASSIMLRKDAFKNGCRNGTGFLFKAQRLIRHGDLSFDDCRNINN